MRAVSTFYDHIRAVAEQEGVTVAEAMQRARELGITALEVSSFNLKDRVGEVQEELAAGGLAVASACATSTSKTASMRTASRESLSRPAPTAHSCCPARSEAAISR